jgi:hypothetical protein
MSGITARARLSSARRGALALLLVLAAEPVLAVECGDVITRSTRLERDLICTSDPALTVEGGTLDLNGFTVTCDGTVVGVLIEGSGAHLKDGAVTGCELAVWVAGSGGHKIERLTASASNQGIFFESDGNRLSRSNILRALNDAAVQANGSNNHLRLNSIAGSHTAFEINGDDNRIIGNRIGAVAEGVQLMGNGNQVAHNDIIGTTDRGVEVREGAHLIKDNLIADGTADGIAVFSDGNEVRQNVILGHADQGLFVSGLGNTLEKNRVLLNGTDLTDTTPDCDDNLWRDNTFETSVSDGCVD